MLRIDFRDKIGKRKTYMTYGSIDTYENGIVMLSQNTEELYLRCLKKKLDNVDVSKPIIVYVLDENPISEILSVYNTKVELSDFKDFIQMVKKVRESGPVVCVFRGKRKNMLR